MRLHIIFAVMDLLGVLVIPYLYVWGLLHKSRERDRKLR
jgi:hypothetical protein